MAKRLVLIALCFSLSLFIMDSHTQAYDPTDPMMLSAPAPTKPASPSPQTSPAPKPGTSPSPEPAWPPPGTTIDRPANANTFHYTEEYRDTDGDGKSDLKIVSKDVDQDGRMGDVIRETKLMPDGSKEIVNKDDKDEDGNPELTIKFKTDKKGKKTYEQFTYDFNDDGQWDRKETDPDGDGPAPKIIETRPIPSPSPTPIA